MNAQSANKLILGICYAITGMLPTTTLGALLGHEVDHPGAPIVHPRACCSLVVARQLFTAEERSNHVLLYNKIDNTLYWLDTLEEAFPLDPLYLSVLGRACKHSRVN